MRPTRRDDRERRATGVPAALVFAGTFVWGVLSWSGFHNDQFMHLAWADQVRLGELPFQETAFSPSKMIFLIIHDCELSGISVSGAADKNSGEKHERATENHLRDRPPEAEFEIMKADVSDGEQL